MTNKCKTCGHEKKYHKPSQYYKGKGCHFFINKDELDYERCPCKKFIPENHSSHAVKLPGNKPEVHDQEDNASGFFNQSPQFRSGALIQGSAPVKPSENKPDDCISINEGESPETSGFETLSLKIQNAWEGYKGNIDVEDVKEAIRRLLEEWKVKCKRMEIMSGDVAYYELKVLLKEIVGSYLI